MQDEIAIKRDEKGKFLPGTPPGPGRPKGKTMKEYAREYFMLKSDDEKKEYIQWLEEKKPGFAWTMGEGNPENKTDVTSGGQPIIQIAEAIVNKQDDSPRTTE